MWFWLWKCVWAHTLTELWFWNAKSVFTTNIPLFFLLSMRKHAFYHTKKISAILRWQRYLRQFSNDTAFFRSSLRCMQLIIIWMIIECEPRFDIQLNLSTYDIVVGHACMLAPIELNAILPIDLVHWRCTIWTVEFISLVLITLCTQIILIEWFFHLKSQKLKTMKKKRLNSIRNAFARLREVINFSSSSRLQRFFFFGRGYEINRLDFHNTYSKVMKGTNILRILISIFIRILISISYKDRFTLYVPMRAIQRSTIIIFLWKEKGRKKESVAFFRHFFLNSMKFELNHVRWNALFY